MVALPRFLLAAPVERHLCMERPHSMHLRPSLHAVQGIYTYTAVWSHFGGLWDWPEFLWAASLHGTQCCICTAQHYCARPEPCTVPAHCWVVCTLLDLRTQSPCIEFTAPHSTVTAFHVCTTFCPRIYTYSAPRDCVELVFWTGFPHPAVPSALHHILLVLVSLGCSTCLQRTQNHFRENFWSANYVPSPVLVSGGGEVCVSLNLALGHSYKHLSLSTGRQPSVPLNALHWWAVPL